MHVHAVTHMVNKFSQRGKAKQLCPNKTFFSQDELPQLYRIKPTTFCVLGRHSPIEPLRQLSWVGFKVYTRQEASLP